jgi:hypothetical protein
MHPERRPSPSPESLEARLRALPQPPVPPGLEARLLAAVPPGRSAPRRRWAVWVGVAAALAAACWLAALTWPRRGDTGPAPSPSGRDFAHQVTPRPPSESPGVAAWARAGRDPEGAELPPFTWPLEEAPPVTVATALSPDLLE